MTWVAVGTTAFSAISGSLGAKKAAKRRAEAAARAGEELDTGFELATEALTPRSEQEQAAMGRVNALLGLSGEDVDFDLFRNTPGFQFQQEESQRAVERSAAGGRGVLSGGTVAEVARRSQGIAEQGFDTHLNRLLGLQSQGTDFALANLATDRSTGKANLITGAGEARATGIEGQFGAIAGGAAGIADIVSQRQSQNALRDIFNSGPKPVAPS